ncbi:Arginine/ornithine antiporter ArcD [Candidatus Rhodobacter oscarellae]|uniref:Arginine/ornithine antiporter ArcD n=1 Tax=Candidatus Rhodobacter oscarellae TaxID=1675527 RepID=A0A0J9E0X8_9RHOB|nr:MFS transporter [Candidatus Rhodobacter lobularis]KMW56327.1 Arginine/ornithine antiporter ArcD [Candidatus Rhodobacter lobularis]
MPQAVTLADAQSLPYWRRPVALLFLMAFAMPLAFSTWSALLNNFVIEAAGFTGVEIGWLHSIREVPGFFSIGVIVLIWVLREQTLALISLVMLGLASAVTAWFPSFGGLLMVTLFASIGFHYYETVVQSLQLQWIDKDKAPQTLGIIVGIGSGASLLAYGLLVVTWKAFDLSYNFVYLTSGGITAAIAVFCWLAYPQFESPTPQRKEFVLRRRYWLYYALQFMSGARRQIFVVFAAFMMVERFGFEVHEVTALFLINYLANMIFAPLMGRAVARWGERNALGFEYVGLICVFLAYGGIYYFGWGVVLAACLYVLDHLFFALAFALKTYFQKIADPADIAPTAAVAFTINHIAAVFLPALLGYLWIVSPGGVFVLAAGMAATSLALALMIPRHPEPGHETVFSRPIAQPAQSQGPAE